MIRLRHIPDNWLIPWQWWDGDFYLAGFMTEVNAVEYGKRKGWQ